MKPRRRLRWELDVTGWRYTRRWVVGVRSGEWWIGARYDFPCDWLEIGILGLTLCIPAGGTRRESLNLTFRVPVGQDWCPRCGTINYEMVFRVCLTCTFPDDPCSGRTRIVEGATR